MWLLIAAALWILLAARFIAARFGYGVSIAVIVRRPRRNPRLPNPKPGHVVMPLQLRREFEAMLREGVTGIVSLASVGDGTVTLMVEQTQPQGK